ncbi:DUF803-domain-containing protein [Pseudovirgaria hyperparasitica]|uniref:DUF803-domain-containing protein n=1 Tax=Pseudovirgaria hyperparasitica TaxID=470096 RepID=A0A6A6VZ85_9PEZI|nr:DUF803-domain-containing protein [Pseudovirgaria hyperparasitica]KAF2755962.1 DUF803-domain-containing protein [Pseudovirgaria hyperparasitica]
MFIPREAGSSDLTFFLDSYTSIALETSAHLPKKGAGSWSSLIGIVAALVGNVLISVALNIQRYAHIRLEREAEEKERRLKRERAEIESAGYGTNGVGSQSIDDMDGKRSNGKNVDGHGGDADSIDTGEAEPLLSRSGHGRASSDSEATIRPDSDELRTTNYLKSPYWWTGIILMIIGEAGNFLAYGFAPASIVSPLGVVALISNCIVAPIMFGEVFRKRDFLGVLIAVGGAVTVVLSAKSDNPKLGQHEIWDAISRTEFEVYLGITCGLIVVLMVLSGRYGAKSIVIDLGLVGLFGGYTALSTKGVASLLSYRFWRIVTFPVTYLLAFILIFTAVMQIKYVNRALKRFDATQVIPTQFVLFTLSVILGSAILYRDFERTTPEDAGKFIGGCAMTFAGVWLITSGRPRPADDEERGPEPPDAIDLATGDPYTDTPETPKARKRSNSPRSPPSSASRTLDPPSSPRPSTPSSPSHTATPSRSGIPSPYTSLHRAITSPPLPPLAPTTPSASLSTPNLPIPTILSSSRPSTPTPTTPRPHTTRIASDVVLDAPSTPVAQRLVNERTAASSKHSPAPPLLMNSPLTGSLSAMVDSLRRGHSVRGRRSVERLGVMRSGTGESGVDDMRRGGGGGREGEEQEDDERRRIVRGRSLSNTLGEWVRGFIGDGAGDESGGSGNGNGTGPGSGSGGTNAIQ